jgi:hypothetical protein
LVHQVMNLTWVYCYDNLTPNLGWLYLPICRQQDTRSLPIEFIDRLLDQDLSCLVALEIQLTYAEMISKEWWNDLFARLPQLEQLSVGSQYEAISALNALHSNIALTISQNSRRNVVDASTISADSNTLSALLSHLKELFLWDRDFSELLPNPDNQMTLLEDPNSLAYHLTKYLKIRRDCGFQLEKLTICISMSVNASRFEFLHGLAQYTIVLCRSSPFPFLRHSGFAWDLEESS